MTTTTRWILVAVVLAAAGIALSFNRSGQGPELNQTAEHAPTNSSHLHVATTMTPPTGLPRLLDLGAGKCIPCKAMAPILEELGQDYAGRMEVVFLDVWQDPEAGRTHGVEVIPTQIFLDGEGRELFRHQGFLSREDILGHWKRLGFNLEEVGS
jgi:thiol-disulfide isomerase/thioredoxin